jgi:NADH-quinone oxidoreductase subunit L
MNLHLFTKYSLGLHGAAPIFVSLSVFTLAVIAIYSKNYLSREEGQTRYWLLFSLFTAGILLCGFAGNLETFFVGWEMVGLASFFLIGFYQTNERSLENSMIALANYKMCDIFFVLAIFLEEAQYHTLAGASLIIATLAKSAQFPFSSWLYRALEGPTPSSTVFYGGLSLHLGAFLLIQHAELWETSLGLRLLLGSIGLVSALYGMFVGSTRSDVKTTFAFASISQVGLIFIELALGWNSLALWHIVGHNMLRTWNYLRAASFFEDFFKEDHHLRGDLLSGFFRKLPKAFYFHAFNGFYLDRIFYYLRNGSLVFFLGVSIFFVSKHLWHGTFQWEFIFLFAGTLLATSHFLRPYEKVNRQVMFLFLSQVFVLGAIQIFYADLLEEAYILFALLFMVGIYIALRPALQIWRERGAIDGENFLGLSARRPRRHWFFLFCCISLTASPGSLQFFLQESLFDDLWNRSHTFMVLALVCLTVNSFHFFRLGQQAFLGYLNPLPSRIH